MKSEVRLAPGFRRIQQVVAYYELLDAYEPYRTATARLFARLDRLLGQEAVVPRWSELHPWRPRTWKLRKRLGDRETRRSLAFERVARFAAEWRLPAGVREPLGHGSGAMRVFDGWRASRATGHSWGMRAGASMGAFVPEPDRPIMPSLPLAFWWDPLTESADQQLAAVKKQILADIGLSIDVQARQLRDNAAASGWKLKRSREREETPRRRAEYFFDHRIRGRAINALAREEAGPLRADELRDSGPRRTIVLLIREFEDIVHPLGSSMKA